MKQISHASLNSEGDCRHAIYPRINSLTIEYINVLFEHTIIYRAQKPKNIIIMRTDEEISLMLKLK